MMDRGASKERKELTPACRQFQTELADYLEGDARPLIVRHALECEYCSVLLADLQTLRHEAAHLPLEEPPAQLWTGILARLAAERERHELLPACREFQAALAGYLEGEVRPQIERHAEECAFCSALRADLEMLQREAGSLPQEEPPARLWANVRSRLAEEGILREPGDGWARWFPRPAWAHLAVPSGALAFLVLVGMTLLVPPSAVDRNSAWLASSDRVQVAQQVMATEDSALISTVSELQESYERQQNLLAPTIRATYRKGLESLDDSIRQCRASVEQEPTNQLARQLLVAAYSRKAEVLASALKFDVP
jgi:hypothetical protein